MNVDYVNSVYVLSPWPHRDVGKKESNQGLRWEMRRSDVTDHRRDNNRIQIGGLVLETVGEIEQERFRPESDSIITLI